jgi:hypothetical protein
MIATLHDEVGFSELFMADLLNRNSRIEEDLIDQPEGTPYHTF